MNPSYKLTKKVETARAVARELFTQEEIDRIVDSATADRSKAITDFFTPEQKVAFGTYFSSFSRSARVSIAKAFVILADYSDLYRS